MANTFYTPSTVLQKYANDNDYVITNISLEFCAGKFCKIWVEEKDGVSSLLCIQHTPTMFEIFGFGADYAEIMRTSFDFADVNTPPMMTPHAYDVNE